MKYIIKIKDFKLSEKLNKLYESTIEDEPQIGDYVICRSETVGFLPSHLRNKLDLENCIGLILDINNNNVYSYLLNRILYKQR